MSYWTWCDCTRDALSGHSATKLEPAKASTLCGGCQELCSANREPMIHYGGYHYHISCALELLPAPVNPSPYGGMSFTL